MASKGDQNLDPTTLPNQPVAAKAGVTVRTLRFYHKVGLLRPFSVTASGHLRYSDPDLIRLQQSLSLKFLGFLLEDIQEMLRIESVQLQDSLAIQKQILEKAANGPSPRHRP